MFPTENLIPAFLLTLFAGLSTGVGSLIAFNSKKTNPKFLSVSLGFSAGVMIYVSFVELFPVALKSIEHLYPNGIATWITTLAFFGGIFVIGIIDKLIPDIDNPHEMRGAEQMNEKNLLERYSKLKRTGLLMALAIGIHNFPEGLATFLTAVNNPQLGVTIAIAIAIHNIPEGISVSVPIYYATGSKKKAFIWSFLSGLAEPIGAIIGYLILLPFMNDMILGIMFAIVAGIMVFISLDELLPAAEEYGEHHLAIYGLIGGMGVMALSLLLLL
ncbi:MAG: zinc transporter ZupT [Bdellovibrionales bacterium RIFOXYB1_FULL_37_110]|nr:MAG: zinc transporter ZupT [Bdellovibrionales bacterium RIFOXYC1_FULL_37_79]OFZ58221.1 MAG: zinc transporter ZupT [Bdellovibrionales bacterium RIFOXYB1_FULL_37_110]OFZ62306.1 MAG: zinc transporter ZupT [Bdellovibrionales bacterium RIFOXYD1_FULL_36_51]